MLRIGWDGLNVKVTIHFWASVIVGMGDYSKFSFSFLQFNAQMMSTRVPKI